MANTEAVEKLLLWAEGPTASDGAYMDLCNFNDMSRREVTWANENAGDETAEKGNVRLILTTCFAPNIPAMHFTGLVAATFAAFTLHGCSKSEGTTTTTSPTARPAGSTTTTMTPTGNATTTTNDAPTTTGAPASTTTTTTSFPFKGACPSTACKAQTHQGDYCMNVIPVGGVLSGHCFSDYEISCHCDVPEPPVVPTPDPSVPAVSCPNPKCSEGSDYCQNSRPGFPGVCHLNNEVSCSCSEDEKSLRG
ncbi:hypothetical protein FOL47_008666 [Perkinsus chesapeaki]|uniref:Uncharacterized protein n=1 Tax=Perkinsus chesapeaki TaxID=330153 RepID=A0A7J6LCI3_PERCH|nr:hypothetical protein FOL47_008666 [Perkinsus chesapeaki]